MATKIETMEMHLTEIEKMLREKATTAKKYEVVDVLLHDIQYCVRHMDVFEYGADFVSNLLKVCQMKKAGYKALENQVVKNTQRVLARRILEVMTGREVVDCDCTDVKETVLPDARYLYQGKSTWLRKCKHDYTVHFKAGKNGNVPEYEEVTKMMSLLIDEAESA